MTTASFVIIHAPEWWQFWRQPSVVRYDLIRISTDEMDGLLSDTKTRFLTSYPTYFDDRKRVWPIPPDNITVIWGEPGNA